MDPRSGLVGAVFALLLAGGSTLSMANGATTPVKLNDLLEIDPSRISCLRYSPDGNWVVFRAILANEIYELFSVPTGGGPVTKLNAPLNEFGDVTERFEITGDSSRVVYVANAESNLTYELYSVAIGGGAVTKLHADLPHAGGVGWWHLSPDSSRVVYSAGYVTREQRKLYSVPVAGDEPPTELSGPFDRTSAPRYPSTSADSLRVIFLADAEGDGEFELYSVALAGGGPPTKLSDLPVGRSYHCSLSPISPDSSRVVFCAETDGVFGEFELYSVALSGGEAPVKLSGTMVAGGTVSYDTRSIHISPDSSRVVYLADADAAGVVEIYSAPLVGGGPPVKLNGALVAGGNVEVGIEISPDSSRVVYRADADTDGVFELYSAALEGGGLPMKLNGPLVAGGDVLTYGDHRNYRISPDSSRVVYRADAETDGVAEYYSVALEGGALPINLGGGLSPPDNNSNYFEISPDSSRVVSLSALDTYALHEAPIAGGDRTDLAATLKGYGEVLHSETSADSSRVIYLADADRDGSTELYSVAAGGGPVIELAHRAGEFQITPDSSRVVYLGFPGGMVGLYSVPIGGGSPTQLSGSLVAGGYVYSFQISDDSSRVVFVADADTNNQLEIYSVPLEGGARAKLNGSIGDVGDVGDESFQLSSDSSSVVFKVLTTERGDPFAPPRQRELHRAALTGAGSPSKLSPQGDSVEFQISSDSTRVAYLRAGKLYSVALAGGPATILPGLGFGGISSGFKISADSSRVVYRAGTDGVFGIYSVALSGGEAPVKLSGTMVAGGSVLYDTGSIHISPDSSRVVYRANADAAGVVEIYSAPLVGGGPPVKLNGALVAGGNVEVGIEISPDSSRVVYRADADTDGIIELYSVDLAGGEAPAKLSGTMVAGGNVEVGIEISPGSSPSHVVYGIEISPDSSRVVYCADADTDGVLELYSAGLEGSGSPTKLSGAMVAGGNVSSQDWVISADSARVVFIADAETDGAHELFSSPIRSSVWVALGGDWDVASNWESDAVPQFGDEVLIEDWALVELNGGAATRDIETLILGGGADSSILELGDGVNLHARAGIMPRAGAVLRGDGTLSTGSYPISIPLGAEIAARFGESLRLDSGAVTNGGGIEASGVPASTAEIDFQGAVNNAAGTGSIAAQDAILRFGSGLTNDGTLTLSGGSNEIFGAVTNAGGGNVVVSSSATAIFHDDFNNSGTIDARSAGGAQAQVTFLGALGGNGVSGGGEVFLEGGVRPGSSTGEMSFGGSLSIGVSSTCEFELGGTIPVIEHDRLSVAGELSLGGDAEIVLINGFVPASGDSFDLWNAGTVNGTFSSISLPALPAGLCWDTAQFNATGTISVLQVPETYASYAAKFALSTPPDGDEDGDTLPNLIEFIFALDPTRANAVGSLITLSTDGADDVLEFSMQAASALGVTLEIERSTDLSAWNSLATRAADGTWSGAATVTVGAAPAGLEQVTMTHPTAPAESGSYRLVATEMP